MKAPTLTTDRLTLRHLERDDFDAVFSFMGDAHVTAHIGDGWATRGAAWQRFCQSCGLWPLVDHGYWAICWRTTGQLVGLGGLGSFERGMPELEGYPEAGYAFAPAVWGKGVASEALGAFVNWSDIKSRPHLKSAASSRRAMALPSAWRRKTASGSWWRSRTAWAAPLCSDGCRGAELSP